MNKNVSSKTMNILQDTEAAWLAGIIDGEGCIHIRKDKVTETSKHRTPSYALIIKVSMCDDSTLTYIQQVTGIGTLQRETRELPKHNVTHWVCRSNQARQFLLAILPYSRTKKSEIELALQFLNLPSAKGGKNRTSPELVAQREEFYLLLQSMKLRNN